MWKLAPVRVSYRNDIVISYLVYMKDEISFCVYIKGHFMTAEVCFKINKFVIVTPSWIECQKLCMCHPLQTPRRVISCRNEQSYLVYMTSEWVFVPEWKSSSETVTGVNSYRYDSLPYEILCSYHVNEYRATRGNWSELVPEWKLRPYHVNTP